jgi:hypothetical protein
LPRGYLLLYQQDKIVGRYLDDIGTHPGNQSSGNATRLAPSLAARSIVVHAQGRCGMHVHAMVVTAQDGFGPEGGRRADESCIGHSAGIIDWGSSGSARRNIRLRIRLFILSKMS